MKNTNLLRFAKYMLTGPRLLVWFRFFILYLILTLILVATSTYPHTLELLSMKEYTLTKIFIFISAYTAVIPTVFSRKSKDEK